MKISLHLLTVVSLALAVSGCVESTNIEGGSTSGVSSCSSLLGGVTCVDGRFIDEAVQNLDYECGVPGIGTVKSRTDSDGGFSCPNNSVVTFSLTHPETPEWKMVLGSVKVRRPADVYGLLLPQDPNNDAERAPSLYFYVTPHKLAGGVNNTVDGDRAINIARLLQTLNKDGTPANLPSRHIEIDMADKYKVDPSLFPPDALTKDIFARPPALDPTADTLDSLTNPAPGTFDAEVKSFLTALGKTQLVTSAEARATLKKGVYSTYAGAYASAPVLLVTNTPLDGSYGNMIGYDNSSPQKKFLGQFWALVDRRGRMVGAGIYSYGNSADTQFLWSDPQAMDLKGFGATNDRTWPYAGDLAGMRFELLGHPGKEVRITKGLMTRGAIAGTSDIFQTLFGEPVDSLEDELSLGEWALDDGSSSLIVGAPYTFEHTVPAAPLMNPELWDPDDLDFPIPLLVTLRNIDSSCDTTTSKGCKIAEIPLLILEDGNIVSDIHKKCGVGLDRENLKYSAAEQEYSLGLVSNIIRGDASRGILIAEDGGPITIMTPLVMLPNIPELINEVAVSGYESYLPYIQFVSNFGENSLLRVDADDGDQYQMYGVCAEEYAPPLGQRCSVVGRLAPKVAEWTNNYTLTRLKRVGVSSPLAPDLSKNSDGFIESRRRLPSECLP